MSLAAWLAAHARQGVQEAIGAVYTARHAKPINLKIAPRLHAHPSRHQQCPRCPQPSYTSGERPSHEP